YCAESGYAANVEAVTTPTPAPVPWGDAPAAWVADTPGATTIDALVAWANGPGAAAHVLGREVTAADTLKTVMVKVREPGGEWEPLGVGLPGDRAVDEGRLEASLEPAEVAVLDDADFAAHPYLVRGHIGPRALAEHGVRYLVDPRVADGTRWITAADAPDKHV